MRRLIRAVKWAAISLLLLAFVGVGALLALRAYRQHVTAQAIAISSPRGIDESMYVKIGGIDQWIRIRGRDRTNPVLLCLHGGPGGTWTPLTTLFVPWEKDFTIVQWDQRGAGKTLETTGPEIAATMTIPRMAADGIEVAEYLRKHLHADKIVLLGHSFGSILGIRMVRERPDLFAAYVGTGQVSSMPRSQQWSYDRMLARVRAAGDRRATETLTGIGRPPFDSMEKVGGFFGVVDEYGSDGPALASLGAVATSTPDFSLWDLYNRFRGFRRVPPWLLYRDMLATDLNSLGLDFQVPVFFLQGDEDDLTPASFAREYFDRIQAPHKEMWLLHGGHFAVWTRREEFLRLLREHVKPWAPPPRGAL